MSAGGHLANWRRGLAERRRSDPTLFRVQAVLGTVLLVLLIVVLTGDPREGVPERLAEAKPVRPVDYWRTWGWSAALVNLAAVTLLLRTTRRWLVRGPSPTHAELARRGRLGAPFVLAVLGAMAACAVLAAPRLSQSFDDDEEYNVTHSIDGAWLPDGKGGLRFADVKWRDTFWHYKMPNNHVAHTILARLSLATWRQLTGNEAPFAHEAAVRAPAYLAGIAAVGSLALLLWRLGYPAAGVLAAWLAALHPWWFRYASEARGYSLVLLLLTAGLTLLVRALHRGSWQRWLAYGASQFLLLWTNPGLAFHVAIVNVVAALALWRLNRGTPALGSQAIRFAAVHVLGAMLWVQLMAPNLAQVGAYMENTGGKVYGWRFVQTTLSQLTVGMPWRHARVRGLDPIYPELWDVFQQSPAACWLMLGLLALGLLAGVARLVCAGGFRAWLPVVFLLPGVVTYEAASLRGANIYTWYLIFVMPCAVALLSLGLTAPAAARRGQRAAGAATAALCLGFLLGYAWLTGPARHGLRTRSFEAARESAELTRPVRDPLAAENRRILTVQLPDWDNYYDPLLGSVESVADLEAWMARADAQDLALYVNSGRMFRHRRYRPELVALLEDPVRFEPVGVLHGFEPPWTRVVYRYREDSAAALDQRE